MTDILDKKLESKIDNKLVSKQSRKRLEDGFKKGKVVNEVLDKPTVMTLYKMITDHIIEYVNGSVSAGKESVLFWGVDKDNKDVALKIYLVSTSNFKKRESYILGDPRFSHVRKGTKTWFTFGQKRISKFNPMLQSRNTCTKTTLSQEQRACHGVCWNQRGTCQVPAILKSRQK